MPRQISNRFTEFEFTNEELYGATRFTHLQLMLFQSLVARAAGNRLTLELDPTKIVNFAQQEAALKAEQDAYDYLLVLADTIEAPQAGEEKQQASITIKVGIPPANS